MQYQSGHGSGCTHDECTDIRDIVFRNIDVGTGHGITIGSESSGGVYNVTFENIRMAGGGNDANGPRIKPVGFLL